MRWPILTLSSLAFMLLVLSCGSGGITGQYLSEEDAEYWLFVEEDNICSVVRWVRDDDSTFKRIENDRLPGWFTKGSFSTVSTGRYEMNGPEITLSCLESMTANPGVKATLDGKTLTTEDGQRWVRQ